MPHKVWLKKRGDDELPRPSPSRRQRDQWESLYGAPSLEERQRILREILDQTRRRPPSIRRKPAPKAKARKKSPPKPAEPSKTSYDHLMDEDDTFE